MARYTYFEGKIIPMEQAKVGVMTHALHYGTGCFEGIRAYWNVDNQQLYVFRMLEHYQRLEKSAHILRMTLPHSAEELCHLTIKLLQEHKYQEDVYIRPLAYKSSQVLGCRLHGLQDDVLIYAIPFDKYIDNADKGVRCMISPWRRVDDNAIPARAKITGAYVNSALSKSAAVENGYDEAIALTQDGHVSEGSAENIFIVVKGKLITPPVYENILEGITRNSIIQIAQEKLGLETVERPIDHTELYTADECFLSGTAAEVTPVTEIDLRRVGNGKQGPLTAQIAQLYSRIVRGQEPAYQTWLWPVY